MFDHLVRDGIILFLIGIAILNKICPFMRQSRVSDLLPTFVTIGWLATIVGFVSLISGVFLNSW
jgi:hypothetical protein